MSDSDNIGGTCLNIPSWELSNSVVEEYLRPTCFICKKPVDKIKHWRNAFHCSIIFVVGCHEDEETYEMTDVQIFELRLKKISPGYAFINKRIGVKNNNPQSPS